MNYYLNDGVYGSFNNLVYDHAVVELPLLDHDKNMLKNEQDAELKDKEKRPAFFSRFFGPTCDGFDVIMEGEFPLLKEGERLIWPDMGAYTQAAASKFNGFEPPKKIYLNKPCEKKTISCRRGYI